MSSGAAPLIQRPPAFTASRTSQSVRLKNARRRWRRTRRLPVNKRGACARQQMDFEPRDAARGGCARIVGTQPRLRPDCVGSVSSDDTVPCTTHNPRGLAVPQGIASPHPPLPHPRHNPVRVPSSTRPSPSANCSFGPVSARPRVAALGGARRPVEDGPAVENSWSPSSASCIYVPGGAPARRYSAYQHFLGRGRCSSSNCPWAAAHKVADDGSVRACDRCARNLRRGLHAYMRARLPETEQIPEEGIQISSSGRVWCRASHAQHLRPVQRMRRLFAAWAICSGDEARAAAQLEAALRACESRLIRGQRDALRFTLAHPLAHCADGPAATLCRLSPPLPLPRRSGDGVSAPALLRLCGIVGGEEAYATACALFGADIAATLPVRSFMQLPNQPSLMQYREAFEALWQEECRAGCVIAVPPGVARQQLPINAPIGIVPKKDASKVRAIFNFSGSPRVAGINGATQFDQLCYPRTAQVADIARTLRDSVRFARSQHPCSRAGTVDLTRAFRMFRVRPVDVGLLRISLPDGTDALDTRCPMGLCCSGAVVCATTNAICNAWSRMNATQGWRAVPFVDDVLIIASASSACIHDSAARALQSLINTFETCLLPISNDKTVLPSAVASFVGYTIDLASGAKSASITLDAQAHEKLLIALRCVAAQRSTTIEDAMSFCGRAFRLASLQPLTQHWPRAMLREMAIARASARASSGDTRVQWSKDTAMMARFLIAWAKHQLKPVPLMLFDSNHTQRADVHLITDASSWGAGFIGVQLARHETLRATRQGPRCFAACVPWSCDTEVAAASSRSETAAAAVALTFAVRRVQKGSTLQWFSDSMSAIAAMSGRTGGGARHHLWLAWPIARRLLAKDCRLLAAHVRGEVNTHADMCSRAGQVDHRWRRDGVWQSLWTASAKVCDARLPLSIQYAVRHCRTPMVMVPPAWITKAMIQQHSTSSELCVHRSCSPEFVQEDRPYKRQ